MPNPPLIVLIEDNVGHARWFWMQLRERGVLCDVTTFNTGEAALQGLSEMPAPDLIVADWRLPMLDGAQLITELKRIPGLDRVPVVVLTGVGDLRSTAFQAGAICCPEEASRLTRRRNAPLVHPYEQLTLPILAPRLHSLAPPISR